MKKIISTVLIVASLATSAMAFEQQGVKDGNNVLALDLRYTSTSPDAGESNDMATVFGSFSHFLTDSIELGLGLGYTLRESNSMDSSTLTLTPFVQYNFGDVSPTMVPYIGVGVSIFSTDSTSYPAGGGTATESSDSETGYSAEGGLKIFISEKTSVVPAIYYESYDLYSVMGFKVGLQVYF